MFTNEGYRNVIPVPHTIGETFREALSEITEKTDQELYFPTDNEDQGEQVVVTYVPVDDVEGKIPSALGWYEKSGEDYVLTEDNEPVEGKTYYIVQE